MCGCGPSLIIFKAKSKKKRIKNFSPDITGGKKNPHILDMTKNVPSS